MWEAGSREPGESARWGALKAGREAHAAPARGGVFTPMPVPAVSRLPWLLPGLPPLRGTGERPHPAGLSPGGCCRTASFSSQDGAQLLPSSSPSCCTGCTWSPRGAKPGCSLKMPGGIWTSSPIPDSPKIPLGEAGGSQTQGAAGNMGQPGSHCSTQEMKDTKFSTFSTLFLYYIHQADAGSERQPSRQERCPTSVRPHVKGLPGMEGVAIATASRG